MIYLITGTPGAGKTLFTLNLVLRRAAAEDRPVYYSGIEITKPELFPNWHVLEDPALWYELPDGAIVVHDECQKLYRGRSSGVAVPRCVAELETHRHRGFDLYFITQHPRIVDLNLRRLAGEHIHVVRAFGAKFSTVHRWPDVKDEVEKSRSGSVKEQFVYPRALFGAYVSASVHTHKLRVPMRVWLLPIFFVVAGLCVWFVVSWVRGAAGDEAKEVAATAKKDVNVIKVSNSSNRPSGKSVVDWLLEQSPRVEGLPHTAPMYDQVTAPVRAPYPAACVASAARCICYTRQATRIGMPEALCREIADKGYFVAWDDDKGAREGRVVSADTPVLSGPPRPMVADSRGEDVSGRISSAGPSWGGVSAADTWGGIAAR